jgi:4-hydroxy-3-methylbut-2-enyl diphosphate reductase
MNLAFSCLEQSRQGDIYSYGPLIHNRQALDLLENKGLKLWPEDWETNFPTLIGATTVIIRAHGLAPETESALRATNVSVVDATCPRVAQVQRLVTSEVDEGSDVVIWGSSGHPEVEGLLGYAGGRGHVVAQLEDIELLPPFEKVLLVAQTTQDYEKWEDISQAVLSRWPESKRINTICSATVNRQKEARRLSTECQGLVVVGGRNSGNTKRLFEIGKAAGRSTISVEGPEEIDSSFVEGLSSVGLVAGASTPLWQLRAVHQKLASLSRSSESSPFAFAKRFMRALVLSSMYLGLGGGCLGIAAAGTVGYAAPDYFFGLFFFFVQAMHLLNSFLDPISARYNEPDRGSFLKKYGFYLLLLCFGSFVLSFTAAALAGPLVLMVLSLLCLARFLYEIRLPFFLSSLLGVKSAKELSFGKCTSAAMGWAVLLTAPALLSSPPLLPHTLSGFFQVSVIFLIVFLQVLCRTLLMDFQDSLGDRMFGRRTLVVALGWKVAEKFLSALLCAWSMVLFVGCFFLPHWPLLLWLWISGPLFNAVIFWRFMKKPSFGDFKQALFIDSQFLLSVIGVAIWKLI